MDYLYSKFDPTDEKENYHVQEYPLFRFDMILEEAVAYDEEKWEEHFLVGLKKIEVEVLD